MGIGWWGWRHVFLEHFNIMFVVEALVELILVFTRVVLLLVGAISLEHRGRLRKGSLPGGRLLPPDVILRGVGTVSSLGRGRGTLHPLELILDHARGI